MKLPEGFVLDSPASPPQGQALPNLPEGFVLDSSPQSRIDDAFSVADANKPSGLYDKIGSFNRGVIKGLTFNLADEAHGILAAGQGAGSRQDAAQAAALPNSDPRRKMLQDASEDTSPFVDAIRGAGRLVGDALGIGGGDATKRYQQAVQQERAKDAFAEASNPKTALAGQVIGSLPAFAVMPNPTGAAGFAAQGAGIGALSGFGQGEGLSGSLKDAAVGAGIGGALGVAVPKITGAIGKAGGYVANKVTQPFRGAINTENEAARRIASSIGLDRAASSNILSPAEIAAAKAQGSPLSVVDMGGETTRALARSAADTSTVGRQVLQDTLEPRLGSQSERLYNVLESVLPNKMFSDEARAALKAAAAKEIAPAYKRAYTEGSEIAFDDTLQALTSAPIMQSTIKDVLKDGANKAVAEGMSPIRSPFTVDADGALSLAKKADGSIATPNLQFWDYVKRGLDDKINVLKRQGANDEARTLDQIRRQLRDHLDSVVPSYQAARQRAASAFGAEDASEAGENALRSSLPLREFQKAFTQFSPSEKELFRQGYITKFMDELQNTQERRNVLNATFLGSTAAKQKMQFLLGKEGTAKMESALRVENIMEMSRTAVSGGSKTARLLAEQGLAGGAGAGVGYFMDGSPQSMLAGAALASALKGGAGKVDQRVQLQIAKMLASGDERALKRVAEISAKSPAFSNALKAIEARLSGVAAGNSANSVSEKITPMLAGPKRATAETEEPQKGAMRLRGKPSNR